MPGDVCLACGRTQTGIVCDCSTARIVGEQRALWVGGWLPATSGFWVQSRLLPYTDYVQSRTLLVDSFPTSSYTHLRLICQAACRPVYRDAAGDVVVWDLSTRRPCVTLSEAHPGGTIEARIVTGSAEEGGGQASWLYTYDSQSVEHSNFLGYTFACFGASLLECALHVRNC